jgi:hypothetical protein
VSNNIETKTIHCDNDCLVSGCPSHEFELHYQSTSDYFTVSKDGKTEYGADLNEMEALLECLFKMSYYRVEVAGIIERAQRKAKESREQS